MIVWNSTRTMTSSRIDLFSGFIFSHLNMVRPLGFGLAIEPQLWALIFTMVRVGAALMLESDPGKRYRQFT